jgi:hypothetical protein
VDVNGSYGPEAPFDMKGGKPPLAVLRAIVSFGQGKRDAANCLC